MILKLHRGAAPGIANTDYLMGVREALGAWLVQAPNSILATLEFFFLLLGLKVTFELLFSAINLKMPKVTDALAAIAFISIFALPRSLNDTYVAIELPTMILVYAIAVLIVFRFGLVPLVCAIYTVDMLANVPLTANFSAWYMPPTLFALLSVVALAGWGFYHSLGGQPLLSIEEE